MRSYPEVRARVLPVARGLASMSFQVSARARISVIVLNWNGLRFLGPCLESLSKQTWSNFQTVLVDNGSVDGSVQYVRTNFPSVRIIENLKNLGFAEGNNVGFRSSAADYVVLLNNDTRASPDFVETLLKYALADPTIGSVGCTIVREDGTIRYGPVFTNRGLIVPRFMRAKKLQLPWRQEGYCLANCGAAVLYRKSALDVIGGFDGDFWSDWEDHDLGYRLWLAGYKNFYTTGTNVVHVGGGSFGHEVSKERYTRIIRNTMLTYLKNYEPRNVVTRFFLLFFLVTPLGHMLSIVLHELARFSKSLSGELGAVSRTTYLSLPEAYFCFLRGLRNAMRRRAMVQAQRTVCDRAIFSTTERRYII